MLVDAQHHYGLLLLQQRQLAVLQLGPDSNRGNDTVRKKRRV
jgi:hypothetical protein